MLKTKILFSCLLAVFLSFGQQQITDYGNQISKEILRKHLSILASDSLEGRNTGDRGQHMAADYLMKQFQQLQCKPYGTSFFQSFNLYKGEKSGSLQLDDQTLNFPQNFGFFEPYEQFQLDSKLLFLNSLDELKKLKGDPDICYGICVNSLKDIDLENIPKNECKAVFFFLKEYRASYFSAYNAQSLSYSSGLNQTQVFFIDINSLTKSFRNKLKKGKDLKKLHKKLSLNVNEHPVVVPTENVIAFIEGSDSLLKKEVLVISAHYDHLGIKNGLVYNGADDNGTGTSALLELARIFQKAKNEGMVFKRSILFICMTGEEHGLFGSQFYAEHPLIPLKQTISDLNIDMIGRADPAVEKEQFRVYVIGADRLSDQLHEANERAAKTFTKLNLDYKYNRTDDKLRLYYRSDHYNFAKNGIPSIFYFGGFHDDYHEAGDDVEKIDFDKLQQITQLVFYTACELLNAAERPLVNK